MPPWCKRPATTAGALFLRLCAIAPAVRVPRVPRRSRRYALGFLEAALSRLRSAVRGYSDSKFTSRRDFAKGIADFRCHPANLTTTDLSSAGGAQPCQGCLMRRVVAPFRNVVDIRA